MPYSIIFNFVTTFIRQKYHMSTPENTYKNRSLFDGVQDVVAAGGNEYLNIESGVFLGYGRPSTTAKPLARSVFRRNADVGISPEWVPRFFWGL